jgi:hypothetical protein
MAAVMKGGADGYQVQTLRRFRPSHGVLDHWQDAERRAGCLCSLVDDFGIDAVIRKGNDEFVEVQIKARSSNVLEGDAALFAAIEHPTPRKNYYFVFYSERLDATWVMSSEQFIAEANQNKAGKNAGKRSIWFNGKKIDKQSRQKIEYPYPKFDKYRVSDFSIFRQVTGLVAEPILESGGETETTEDVMDPA